MEKALLHKAHYWSYEDEWRVIRTKRPGAHPYEPKALDAIIFGAKIDPSREASIRDAALQGGVANILFRATFDDNLFKLNIVPA
jgi:hypothetical protein